MRFCLAAAIILLGAGCVARQPGKPIATQVVTFPDGALVEFNGEPKGRAPAEVILPQDQYGRLTGRGLVRAIPNTEQGHLYAQDRLFEPGERQDRVPHQIMIDMTLRGTNAPAQVDVAAATSHTESDTRQSRRKPVPYVERSKPTQAVGIDRWNPGKY